MFIAYSLIKLQDHGHRKKTQAILALIKAPEDPAGLAGRR